MTDTASPDWHHPSPRLWRMRRAELAHGTVLLAALVGLIFLGALGGRPVRSAWPSPWPWGPAMAWFVRRRFRAWRYQERHEDLLVGRGVMVHRLSVVPYGRMQFVEVTAGPD
jgi:membrane protein YdbS with pleckstrin-like domain